MKYTDLNNKSIKELNELLKEKKMLSFTLKNKLKLMQLTNTGELREVRKNIAQISTAISDKRKNNA
jgi:large subunit ribosomal protein L29